MTSVLEAPSSRADASSPLDEQRQALVDSYQELEQALNQFANANVWQTYLKLPEFVRSPLENGDNPVVVSPVNSAALSKLLQRFDRAAERPDYHLINKMPSFQLTHENLQTFSDSIARSMEELPPPAEGN